MVQSNYKRDDYLSFEFTWVYGFFGLLFFLLFAHNAVSCCFQNLMLLFLLELRSFHLLFELLTAAMLSFVTIVTGVAVAEVFFYANELLFVLHSHRIFLPLNDKNGV